ncbi:PLP-dependent aminotransferase family protein [Staphylococcus massiliensis]|uniref:GntR family transcriptional regulator n=1 Tax=Staphylococcus massiliensis S46 TaxID=1229783 RepID=K9AJH4_9STAP|nr:PLP-dependent aminotransferase family protein [Staphylococcus massiliensis]EKU47389.1 GntR family transcriptional regulator [Staphylococcus massiliensis S46]MCG3400307.1 PLP-dependent aminotransferase family protein [Staphylococcus massiliensis]MCG3402001.1 PLP-dependent aminotransferase family protein [Staphylococcus massiliensis]MCG3412335.1 PLP-dependent aminotransferase family protein [Staphylococcus massiliensis]PNZ99141.1 PLP-dependent aminotransferase family protein [Staphylococcus m
MKKSTPLYMQLYESLKEQIIEGQYESNERFPSKRQLSEHLNLSATTIEHAYQQLLEEGFIYSKPRSGYFVSEIETLPVVNRFKPVIESKEEEKPLYRYGFFLTEIDTSHFPFAQFRKYAKEAFNEDNRDLLKSGAPQGEMYLRKQIAHYLFNSRGVKCHPDQIIVGSSTKQLINLITELLPNDKFIIERPSYPPVKETLERKQIPYQSVEVASDGIEIKPIKSTTHNVLYVTPSHQFPTGATMHIKKRTQLLKWSREDAHRYIIEDDYDSEFRYYGKPLPALQSLDTSGKVIYISTFSKSLFPSCRIAYVVLPEALLARYKQLPSIENNSVPKHIQFMVSEFMASGGFERHLNKMRKIYKEKLQLILKALKPYKDQLKITGERTGMHFLLTVTNGLSLESCLSAAKDHQLYIKPLAHYDANYVDQPVFVISFGGIPTEEIREHVDILIKSLTIKKDR